MSGSSDDTKLLKWYLWQNVTVVNYKEILERTLIRGSLMQRYSSLINMILTFVPHHYIKCCQSKFYNEQKEHVTYGSSMAMLQIDFTENYPTIWQDEIQSAHWHNCLLEWVRTSIKCNYIWWSKSYQRFDCDIYWSVNLWFTQWRSKETLYLEWWPFKPV